MDPIDTALTIADNEWRLLGIQHRDRAALVADLRLDLEAAAADGVTPEQLLGGDIRGFARRLADESGVARVPREYPRLLLTMLTGAVLGATLGYLVMSSVYSTFVSLFDLPSGFEVPLALAIGVYYGVPAAIVVGGALVAVRVHLRDVPRIGRTIALMGLLLPVAGAAVTPITMGFARLTDYSFALPVVATEIALVVAALVGATLLARRLSLRDHTVPAVS
ncbi:hypothetical protein [Micromonospora sp. NBC_01796]|uniref:hypothetical protein n=1 Tax=Micromonospora sp. NBC_01796 TaxID=2975987 RepID=UPI002DDA7E37|nr:hypothetical protein [Micromonospora sp. NBC_01796]WSA83668.1 DUF1048 domain-containing protein [Micromonospora sp. NBC_01796]